MAPFAFSARMFGVLASLTTLIAVLTGCGSGNPIVNHWIHSHEEDSVGVQTYRPSTYAFPLSRGREGWDFRADGTAIRYAIAPADGNEADTGRWSMGEGGLLTVTIGSDARPFRYNVLHVDTALLKLQILR